MKEGLSALVDNLPRFYPGMASQVASIQQYRPWFSFAHFR
jgi:hypothetical protein